MFVVYQMEIKFGQIILNIKQFYKMIFHNFNKKIEERNNKKIQSMKILQNQSTLSLHPQHCPNPKSIFFNIGKKTLDRDNTLKFYHHDQNMKLSISKLTQQQVKNSQMYNNLLDKIEQIQQNKIKLQIEHHERIKKYDRLIGENKETMHRKKFQLWELRNHVMQLQEQINGQIQQFNQLDLWLNNRQQYRQQQQLEQDEDDQQCQQGLLNQSDQNNENTQINSLRDKNQLFFNNGSNRLRQIQKLQFKQQLNNNLHDNHDLQGQQSIHSDKTFMGNDISISCTQI